MQCITIRIPPIGRSRSFSDVLLNRNYSVCRGKSVRLLTQWEFASEISVDRRAQQSGATEMWTD
jgi:hypothetical protein